MFGIGEIFSVACRFRQRASPRAKAKLVARRKAGDGGRTLRLERGEAPRR